MIMLLLSIALVGFLVYLIVTYIPMPELFKTTIIVITVIVIILWFLRLIGINDLPILRIK